MKIYLVGGALRDRLLNLPVRDRDWVVVGATRERMLALGFSAVDAEFPVFIHPATGEEYALARRETKTGPGYKGFTVEAGPEVSLEEDLIRRDLTINALAEDESGLLIDPFGGRDDLDNGLLRHISPAFVEDPVRLLRVARFAARLGRWGFRVAHGTHRLLQRMADSGELDALRPERFWREMKQALAEDQPWRFFEVLQRCGALTHLIPELDRVLLPTSGHDGQGGVDSIAALRRAVNLNEGSEVRFAVLMYQAARQAGDTPGFLLSLRAEREYAELLEMLLRLGDHYPTAAVGDPEKTLKLIEQGRALQQPERFKQFLVACDALWPTGSDGRVKITDALDRVKGINVSELQGEGLQGAALGQELRRRRLAVLAAGPLPENPL